MKNQTVILLKDLPCCPAGKVFTSLSHGLGYYLDQTDEEVTTGKIKFYSFSCLEVESNPDWFQPQTPLDSNTRQVLMSLTNLTKRTMEETVEDMETLKREETLDGRVGISDLDAAGLLYGRCLEERYAASEYHQPPKVD